MIAQDLTKRASGTSALTVCAICRGTLKTANHWLRAPSAVELGRVQAEFFGGLAGANSFGQSQCLALRKLGSPLCGIPAADRQLPEPPFHAPALKYFCNYSLRESIIYVWSTAISSFDSYNCWRGS